MEVTNLCHAKPHPKTEAFTENGAVKRLLSRCEYFTVYSVDVEKEASFNADETSFHNILILEGEAVLKCGSENLPLKKGDSVFVPAGCGEYALTGTFKSVFTRID